MKAQDEFGETKPAGRVWRDRVGKISMESQLDEVTGDLQEYFNGKEGILSLKSDMLYLR